MKIRVKNKWNDKDKQRTPEETGSVLGFNLWKVASANVMHMENEGFETDTNFQRLDVIAEFTAFFVHVIDRILSDKDYSPEDRQALITALALNLAKTMHDNRQDLTEDRETDFRGQYIQLLNERMAEYSNFSFDGELNPGFQVRRCVGNHVRDVMGEKDNKWVPDQVIDIEIPDAMKAMKRILRGML
ncbi:MAG TPA: hypothetical protein ENJ11_06635 [Gammaproteobacteria bacterium]|nr:hypothetical protein [Gammaproteobacteria bacterium]